jgi:hypothetical protein
MRSPEAPAAPYIPEERRFQKVKERGGLVRDITNGAIINNNLEALQAYRIKKQSSKQIEVLGDEINNLKSDMSEIKDMLSLLVTKECSK